MENRFSFELVNAEDYDALRPDYGPEAVAWVAERGGLDDSSVIVDLAAGTGQLSRRFSRVGAKLVAVEPARNMRAVIQALLERIRDASRDLPEILQFPSRTVVDLGFRGSDPNRPSPPSACACI